MPIYRITFPNRTPVDVQGTAIRTETVNTQIPPGVPALFRLFAFRLGFGSVPSQIVNVCSLFSYTPATFIQLRSGGNFYFRLYGTNIQGQQIECQDSFGSYASGSAYVTPGTTTVSRCDAIVTTASGEIRLQGDNGQICPGWTETPDNQCRADEIKCDDPSDPRGFCCVSCDSLNSKIRALI